MRNGQPKRGIGIALKLMNLGTVDSEELSLGRRDFDFEDQIRGEWSRGYIYLPQ
jgi:hypothetical protein